TIPCHHRGCRARRLRSRDCKHRSHSRRAQEAGARAKQEDPGASPAEDRAGHGAGAAVAAIARGFGEIAVRPARRTTMRQACGMLFALIAAAAAMTPGAYAQQNPYREDGWGKLPDGRKWGQTSAIDIDRSNNIWVFE